MATLFSDPFTRADNTNVGANWSEDQSSGGTSWEISSNQLKCPSTSGPANADIASTTSTAMAAVADMKVTVKIVTGAGWDGGPIARKVSNTFYALDIYISGAQWKADLYRFTSLTASTLIATSNITAHAANDSYRLELQGTALRSYRIRSGVETALTTGTDSNITAAGQAGVHSWSGNNHLLDDVLVEDYATSGTPAQPVVARQEPHWSQIYEKWAGRRSPGIYPEPATLSRRGRRQRRKFEESLRRSPVRLAA